MPSYRVHLVGGFLTYLGILQVIKQYDPSPLTIVQGLLFCLLGALFPDIDVKSKGQQIFYSMLAGLLIFLLYQQQYCLFASMSFIGIIPILVRHRGIFHYIWFLLLLALGITYVIHGWCGYWSHVMIHNAWFFCAGAISHVVLDRVVTQLKIWFKIR